MSEADSAAQRCRNTGGWPVIVGEELERPTGLASPIILPDDPRVAPESLGDLFDATEIEQRLVLGLLSLGEGEHQEGEASAPRAREILDRAETLPPEALRRLHGAVRSFRCWGDES